MLSSETKKRCISIAVFCILSIISATIVMVLYHTYLRHIGSNEASDIIVTTTKSPNIGEVCSNDWVGFIGDGYCDDEANTEACLYDLGDCCDFHSISQSLCIECFCYVDHTSLLASITQCSPELLGELIDKWENLGNGQCNNELNSLDNFFDAGDCCYDPDEIHQCIDSNVFCNPDTLGDGKCQDYNNGPKCDFDLGDCCSLDVSHNQNGTQCCYCQCHKPEQSTDYWLENGHILVG